MDNMTIITSVCVSAAALLICFCIGFCFFYCFRKIKERKSGSECFRDFRMPIHEEEAAEDEPLVVNIPRHKPTAKEREERKKEALQDLNKDMEKLLLNAYTCEKVRNLYPTRQRIWMYLAEERGAKRWEMARALHIPMNTLEKALTQLYKEGMIQRPENKKTGMYYALSFSPVMGKDGFYEGTIAVAPIKY